MTPTSSTRSVFRRKSLYAVVMQLGVAVWAGTAYAQPATADAERKADDIANHSWQAGAIQHAQRMRRYGDRDKGEQATPPVILQFEKHRDPSGLIGSFQPGGPTNTLQNAFFADLGTNGRTCFSCHQARDGWSVSAAHVRERFYASFGADPIFRLVDGAVCPSADISNYAAKLSAYSLLISKGLFRIGLQLPAGVEFRVAKVDDPYGCNTNPATGLTSPTSGIVSAYRRTLPSTNLGFLSAIMWDGREPSLASQAVDATLGHAEATAAPNSAQVAEIVAFESGVFTAQIFDHRAKELDDDGGKGGPVHLQANLSTFYIGINDPLGLNPKGIPFTSKIFDIYDAWQNLWNDPDHQSERQAVVRGEALFNNTPINITDVGGLNDALGRTTIAGFCGTCHDTPNVGHHSVKAPLNIGVANAGARAPPALDIAGLPVFHLHCNVGALAGNDYLVTDIGRATISGKCADIGKFKGPILRGLAARAPYFHNGSAATLDDVVLFYDQRFNIGFTEQQRRDLVSFLRTL